MNIRKTILAIVVMTLSIGLLAACGGDDELTDEEYSNKLGEAFQPLSEIQDLNEATDPNNLEESVSKLEEVQSLLDESASMLEDISPPSDVEDENSELVTAFNEFSASLDPLIEAAQNGDQEQAEEALSDVEAAGQDFGQSFQDIGQRLEDAGVPEPELTSPSG